VPTTGPRPARASVILVAAAIAVAVVAAAPPPRSARPAAGVRAAALAAPALRVSGTRIVDGTGAPIRLHGVNRSGTEYACAQGWGIFDGPSDQASISAMATWNVDAVRVPLNEDCWLGINGVNPSYGGAAYRRAIVRYVRLLETNGMNPILDLHWSAPGDQLALGQQKMPDLDHAPAFWTSMARTFGQDQAVVLDLYNEPHDVTWACWRDGCTVDGWKAAGMQRLVTTVRAAGATNVLLLGGIGWSGDLTQWKAHMPSDPQAGLAAGWHLYDFGSCTTAACWASNVAGVGGAAPVVLGEFGETDCAHAFVDGLMAWADGQGIGYVAWTWDDWAGCGGPTVITDYDGTPTAFGQGVHDHYLTLRPAASACEPPAVFRTTV